MWSGTWLEIPHGWALCNGQNGTPDLRNRFVVGAGDDYHVNNIGGQNQVTLTVRELPRHSHGVSDPGHSHRTNVYSQKGTSDNANDREVRLNDNLMVTSTKEYTGIKIQETGESQPFDIRPLYYALCFIMKIEI